VKNILIFDFQNPFSTACQPASLPACQPASLETDRGRTS